MKYRITLHKSEQGFAVSVPALPGCWSQGRTEQEAIENIRNAIREHLAAVDESLKGEDERELDVSVQPCRTCQASIISPLCERPRRRGFASRQGKHIVMTDGLRFLTIPRHNPVNAITMAGTVRNAGLTIEQFRELL